MMFDGCKDDNLLENGKGFALNPSGRGRFSLMRSDGCEDSNRT